jgi:hypothetical protein
MSRKELLVKILIMMLPRISATEKQVAQLESILQY